MTHWSPGCNAHGQGAGFHFHIHVGCAVLGLKDQGSSPLHGSMSCCPPLCFAIHKCTGEAILYRTPLLHRTDCTAVLPAVKSGLRFPAGMYRPTLHAVERRVLLVSSYWLLSCGIIVAYSHIF